MIRIAFIIPHRGRIELLEKTLNSILKQKDGSVTLFIQVCIVTQNEKLDLSLLGESNTRTVTILYENPKLTISALRNKGVAATDSEYIAFTDADMELSENWTIAMIDELAADTKRIIVSAGEQMPPNPTSLEKIRVLLNNQTKDCSVPFMTGRNLFMKRESFDRIGGFPENLITAEDYYFTGKASEFGILYLSTKAWTIHLGEDKNYREMFTKEIWRSRSNYRSMGGRKIPLSEIPSLVAPLMIALVFPIIFAMFIPAFCKLPVLACALFLFCFPIFLYSFRCLNVCKGRVSLLSIITFYSVYFTARGIGVYKGFADLFKKV